MTILVAEDEAIILKTIELKLRKEGYNVITATNGKEAMEELDRIVPDLATTDMIMPFASGLDVIIKLRSVTDQNIPVIVLSSLGQESVVQEAYELGATDYMSKPFSPNALVSRVKELVKDDEG